MSDRDPQTLADIPRVAAAAFDPARYARGAVHALRVALDGSAADLELPVTLVRGARPGPTLVVTAAVHGDEYEGVLALLQIVRTLRPAEMRGDLLAVPACNPGALRAVARRTPADGRDLARAFPGTRTGSQTDVLAWHLAHHVIAHASFYLDLHSGGVRLAMPCLVGYAARDPRAAAAARIFGAPVAWGHHEISPGRTLSFASARGIPWLYTEAPGSGRVDPADLAVFTRGIVNLLRHLGILPGAPIVDAEPRQLSGAGDTDRGVQAALDGLLISDVALMDEVAAGQEMGRLLDLFGRTIETIRAPIAGVVALVRACPVVFAGETVFLIAGASAPPPPEAEEGAP